MQAARKPNVELLHFLSSAIKAYSLLYLVMCIKIDLKVESFPFLVMHSMKFSMGMMMQISTVSRTPELAKSQGLSVTCFF